MRTLVRIINEWDAPTMLKVYDRFIDTNTCKDTELPTIAQFVQRIDRYTYGTGWIMSEIDGETAGFCLITENSYEPENLFTAEIQLWVKPELQRRRVGDSLYHMMFGIMELGNKKKVYARIPLPNDAAVAFHEHWGFTVKEKLEKAFEKNGEKYDVLVMEKNLNPEDPDADRPIKPMIVKLDKSSQFRKLQIAAGDLIRE
ncbi:MAG: GNAT family N-acetyltransferase [Clostridia bacterium]|nr:GNAT family N-acetyltransferase [Clostridia bacterium]